MEIFSNEAFSQRMKGRTNFYEEQVESHIPIARKEIDEDRDKLKSLEDTLNNLLTWRDKVIAHIDRKYLLKGKTISKEFPLQLQKLEEVINALVHILNRYSDAYNSSTYLVSIPGEDDVQHVMNCIRFRIHEENSRRRHS